MTGKEYRFTVNLTVDELNSLEATVNDLVRAWTPATPSLLNKLRQRIVHTRHTIKASYRAPKPVNGESK